MAAVLEQPIKAPPGGDRDDLVHYVCCRDVDTGFCGLDLSGAEWADEDVEHEMCTGCQLISNTAETCCPFGKECSE